MTDKRSILLHEAVDHVSEHGLEATSMRAICARAGVKLPTLYHYFKDKQGLLNAVITDVFEKYMREKQALPRTGNASSDVRRGWDLHVAFARDNPEIYPLLFPQDRQGSAAANESAQHLLGAFQRLACEHALRPGITAAQAARTLSAALHGVTAFVIRDPRNRNNTTLSTTIRDAVVDALLLPP